MPLDHLWPSICADARYNPARSADTGEQWHDWRGLQGLTSFGADVTREATDVGRLMVAVLDAANDRLNRILRLPSWVPTRRNLREKRALARLDQLLDSFIAAHRASGEKPADLLSMLLAATDEDSGTRMSDCQLHEEMMTLFLAGHETTAMALTWTWYLLSQHPEVEETLVREVSRVLGGRAPTVGGLS
jgi:cytochrome P450